MIRHVAIRMLVAVPTLLAIVTLAFFLMRLAPGGPFDAERQLPPEIEANLKAAYNLDQPLFDQYTTDMQRLVAGDRGPSCGSRPSIVKSGPLRLRPRGSSSMTATPDTCGRPRSCSSICLWNAATATGSE